MYAKVEGSTGNIQNLTKGFFYGLRQQVGISSQRRGCHGRDDMVVGFTTTCAISAYHH
jgi:hypothetical protein